VSSTADKQVERLFRGYRTGQNEISRRCPGINLHREEDFLEVFLTGLWFCRWRHRHGLPIQHRQDEDQRQHDEHPIMENPPWDGARSG
jgi:hypothetical protein